MTLTDLSRPTEFTQRLYQHPNVCRYLSKRGVTSADIDRYEIGFNNSVSDFPLQGILFPVRNAYGNLVGYISRSPEVNLGYNVLPGFHCKQYIYPMWLVARDLPKYDYVVLVEGIFDMISVGHLGIPAVASFGAVLSDKQAQQIGRYVHYVLVALDVDASIGMKNDVMMACSKLKQVGVSTAILSSHYSAKDPDLFIRDGWHETFRDECIQQMNRLRLNR